MAPKNKAENDKEEKEQQDSVATVATETTGFLTLADCPQDQTEAKATYRNFILFSILFSAVPSAALVCLALATNILGSLGAYSAGTLYLTYTLTAIGGATYVVKKVGSRSAVILGMALYCLYIICFLAATLFPDAALTFALVGAAAGGIGAGFLWISYGVYFTQACEEYSLLSTLDWAESTSLLGGIFAFILLAEETVLDILSTLLIRVFHFSWGIVFFLYTMLAVMATVAMFVVRQYPVEEEDKATGSLSAFFSQSISAILLLINDPKMKYMIGLNASFGFAGAFLNSFVSGQVVPMALNDPEGSYIGILVAVHGGVAAIASLGFGFLARWIGKIPVLCIGALAFGSVAFPFLLKPEFTEWTWFGLVSIYFLQGLGRATFEGTLKALFADYFPYEKEGAFANIILQNGLSSALAYVLSTRLRCSEPSTFCVTYQDGSLHNLWLFSSFVVGISVVAVIGLLRAAWLMSAGAGMDRISSYRSRSISNYRKSRNMGGSFVDRKTYQTLQAVIDTEDGLENRLPPVS